MVEIIPKPTEKSSVWQDILFYFSIGIFLAAIVSFFILNNSQGKLENSLRKLDESLAQKMTVEEINLEKEIKTTEKQIRDFAQILNSHLFPSKVFDVFQKIVHPKAWFSRLSFDTAKSEAVISGETESFVTLQQQIFILQKEPLIKSFTLNYFSAGKEGKVDFTFNISLAPELFRQ